MFFLLPWNRGYSYRGLFDPYTISEAEAFLTLNLKFEPEAFLTLKPEYELPTLKLEFQLERPFEPYTRVWAIETFLTFKPLVWATEAF